MFTKILTNKWFWIAISAIILVIILNRNWYRITRLFQPSNIVVEPDESKLTSERKTQLEAIARDLYNSIYGTSDNKAYDAALNLTDSELKYMSKYYRRSVTQGTWLYTDVDNEVFMPWNDRDVRLMAKLSEIGEKG